MAENRHFTLSQTPNGEISHLLIAFRGWPDAGEAATGALRFIMGKLGKQKMAEMDPEEFYDFSHVRPFIRQDKEGRRRLAWPSNRAFFHEDPDPSQSFMFLLGTEPSLKWRTYCDAILDLAAGAGVHTVVHLGALLDAVPHSRSMRITGSSSSKELEKSMEDLSISSSGYQGPSGISAAMLERCETWGLESVSLWGHSPHYLQTSPNYPVTYGLVNVVNRLLGLNLDISDLQKAAVTFQRQLQRIIDDDSQLRSYVQKLESRYDEVSVAAAEMPNAKEMVREVERFLKDRRGHDPE